MGLGKNRPRSAPSLDEYPLPDPNPNFYFATRTQPEQFLKSSEFRVFPTGYFPAGCFKSFYNNPQILLFSSRSDTKSSVHKLKCLKYKKCTQGKSGKFDN